MIVYTEYATVSRDLGVSVKTLLSVSNRIGDHYRTVQIPKKSGGTRTLSVPDPLLKRIQRAIAEKLLAYRPVSPYARAYKIGASVTKNALPHVGKKQILKLDVKHFFDSILYTTVKDKCFPKEQFSEPIRILLAMLSYCGDSLPQGAPSSPIISNIILKDFDDTVGAYCTSRRIAYTRYCDDMTFSGNDFDAAALTAFVKEELFRNGFVLNPAKTALIPKSRRQTVTGIVVNEKLSAPAPYKREIRKEVYFCTKFGTAEHLTRIGKDISEITYLRGLLGRIAFVLSTEPQNVEFAGYKKNVTVLLKHAESPKETQN